MRQRKDGEEGKMEGGGEEKKGGGTETGKEEERVKRKSRRKVSDQLTERYTLFSISLTKNK